MGPPEPIGSSAPGDETSVFKLVFNGFIMDRGNEDNIK
jgi:hypothetical protein